MSSKGEWWNMEDLYSKSPRLFSHEGWTETFVGMIINTHFLRGKRKNKKIYVLPESWNMLMELIEYNFSEKHKNYFNKPGSHKPKPVFLLRLDQPHDPLANKFYSYNDLEDLYPRLKKDDAITDSLLGRFAKKYMIQSRYDYTTRCNSFLKNSFDDLMTFRNYGLDRWKISYEDDECE